MLKRVLITGAYGFIGRHVARQFSQAGWMVIGIGHGSWARDEWRQWGISEWHSEDVTMDTLLTYAGAPDAIIHCAGSGSVGFSVTNPYQDFQRTVDSTVAVLEFARLHASKARVVYPSSAGVYGVAARMPIAEDDPLVPVSPYGVHKKIAEEMCTSYAKNFGLSVAIVRLFSVYGIGLRKQLLWDACVKISNGENTFFGNGTETRDWLHVSDAASMLMSAGASVDTSYLIVNGGTGQGVSVREILSELFDCFHRGDLPEFTGSSRSGDPQHYVADIGNIVRLGMQPKKPWREGVREYAEWFRNGAH